MSFCEPEIFGASGNGVSDDTNAVQAAIDAAAAQGGGRVVLSSGSTYLTGSLHMRPFVELHLQQGARLKASGRLNDYFRPGAPDSSAKTSTVGNPVTGKPSYAFLYGKNAHGCAITGEGVIDGNADAFVHRINPYYVTGDFYPRPTTIYLEGCDHITVKDITITNAPFWTLHPAGCNDVQIHGIRILNSLDVANSDGIDPEHCKNVRITDCHIECADDCICLKNTKGNEEYGCCENILIRGCTLISTSAAVKIGTEGVNDFRNIIIESCIISRSNRGISIQVRDCGNVENVYCSNCIIETRRFSEDWWGTAEPIAITSLPRDAGILPGRIQDIRFSHITCRGENGILLFGTQENRLSGISFEHVNVTLCKTSKWPCGFYDLRPGKYYGKQKDFTSAFYLREAQDVRLSHVSIRWDGTCEQFAYAVDAVNTDGLLLTDVTGAGQNGHAAIRNS